MSSPRPTASPPSARASSRRGLIATFAALAAVLLLVTVVTTPTSARAVGSPIGLGTASGYSVLGGQAVTNTGPTVLAADLGVSPGTAITGFPPGIAAGATHAADAAAEQAQADVTTAYGVAAGRASTASVGGDLVGQTLPSGVYTSNSSLALSGTLTLDGAGDASSVFVFQVASTLVTASGSSVRLINGAQACSVFWQVGSSATLGTGSVFKGTVLALASITVNTGASVEGRALARNGSVTLDNNVFSQPGCNTSPSVTTTMTPTIPTTLPTTIPTTLPGTASTLADTTTSSVAGSGTSAGSTTSSAANATTTSVAGAGTATTSLADTTAASAAPTSTTAATIVAIATTVPSVIDVAGPLATVAAATTTTARPAAVASVTIAAIPTDRLPATGGNVGPLVVTGLVLIGLGIVLQIRRPRRSARVER